MIAALRSNGAESSGHSAHMEGLLVTSEEKLSELISNARWDTPKSKRDTSEPHMHRTQPPAVQCRCVAGAQSTSDGGDVRVCAEEATSLTTRGYGHFDETMAK
jgi:hypothetical protein